MALMAVLLVVAAVVAVVAGYHLGRVVMQVLFSPQEPVDAPSHADDPPATTPSTNKITVALPELELQRVQVGAFGKADGAAQKARTLQDEGVPAFVMGPMGDEFYRVVCGLYTERDAAQRVAESIKRDVFVNQIKIPGKEIILESTDAAALDTLEKAYGFVATTIIDKAKLWDDYQMGRNGGLEEKATELYETVKAQHDAVVGFAPPAGLTDAHQALGSILEALLRSADELKAMTQKQGQEHYINAATFFVEAVEKYLAHTQR